MDTDISFAIALCPFCGGEGKITYDTDRGCTGSYATLEFVFVQCRYCGARGGSSCITFRGREAELIAIKNWNKRGRRIDICE